MNPNATSKFINSPQSAVLDSLSGLVRTNPQIALLENSTCVVLRKPNPNIVHLVCGGGSGHEPAHAGFVTEGCLSGSVCGGVFASPSTKSIMETIEYLQNPKGLLLIIKNYTGDIMNFESAALRCSKTGIKVKTLVVNDDIAFIEKDPERKQARGMCGTVLIYKMLGAACAKGYDLEKLHELGVSINKRIYSLNVSLGACSLPGNPPGFSVQEGSFQLGLGIHGEKGKQSKPLKPCKEIIELMFQQFGKALPKDAKNIVLLVNNLGGCSQLQMGIITNDILTIFSKKYEIKSIICGTLMTSLQMHGFSITIFILDNESEELELINFKTNIPHWHSASLSKQSTFIEGKSQSNLKQLSTEPQKESLSSKTISKILEDLDKNVQKLNEFDRAVGDGDTGTSISRSIKFIREKKLIETLPFVKAQGQSISLLGQVIGAESAGSLGTVLGNLIIAMGSKLSPQQVNNDRKKWTEAIKQGISAIKTIAQCEVGERTVLDILSPLAVCLQNSKSEGNELYSDLVKCSNEASQKVSQLKAKKGRARYLDGKEIGHPDPGCELIRVVVQSLGQSLSSK